MIKSQEIEYPQTVTSRKGRVSRNANASYRISAASVTSRKGRVSRNCSNRQIKRQMFVTSRKGRVSRNVSRLGALPFIVGHVP